MKHLGPKADAYRWQCDTMKALFILFLLMPDGREYKLWEGDNIHACAGKAAQQRIAMGHVEAKTKKKMGYKFICKPA